MKWAVFFRSGAGCGNVNFETKVVDILAGISIFLFSYSLDAVLCCMTIALSCIMSVR